MSSNRIDHPFAVLFSIAFLGVWPILMHDWEVPFLAGTLLWAGVFFVVYWLLVRPMMFPPGPTGN